MCQRCGHYRRTGRGDCNVLRASAELADGKVAAAEGAEAKKSIGEVPLRYMPPEKLALYEKRPMGAHCGQRSIFELSARTAILMLALGRRPHEEA